MVLRKQLATVSGKVKIGAVNGSAFFYAGKAEGAEKAFTDQGYGDMLNRSVKESYQSIIGDGTIIIVDGNERGAYWSIDEAEGKEVQNGEELD